MMLINQKEKQNGMCLPEWFQDASDATPTCNCGAMKSWCIPVKVIWIFPADPLEVNEVPGSMKSNLTALIMSWSAAVGCMTCICKHIYSVF